MVTHDNRVLNVSDRIPEMEEAGSKRHPRDVLTKAERK